MQLLQLDRFSHLSQFPAVALLLLSGIFSIQCYEFEDSQGLEPNSITPSDVKYNRS